MVALVSDNQAVEQFPAHKQTGCCALLPLHEHCQFKQGIYLGELWYLIALAGWLRKHGRNRFLLTAPPLRLLGALTGARGPFDGRVEVERVFAQKRNADFETETQGYTLVNVGLDWHPLEDRPELTLGLTANNLFDVVARRHASLLRDYAPLAGRDIRLTARFTY